MIKRHYKREISYLLNTFLRHTEVKKKQTFGRSDKRMTQIFIVLSDTAICAWGFSIQQSHGNFERSGSRICFFFCGSMCVTLIHAYGGVLRSTHAPQRNEARMSDSPLSHMGKVEEKPFVLSLHGANSITNESLARFAAAMLIYYSRRFRLGSPTAATLDVLPHWSSCQL